MTTHDDKGSGGTHTYDQPATQFERRKMLMDEAGRPTTYHALANIEDDLGGRWAEPKAKYPQGPAWSADAALLGNERPLGEDINALPDMEACLEPGAVGPRGQAEDVDAQALTLSEGDAAADGDDDAQAQA